MGLYFFLCACSQCDAKLNKQSIDNNVREAERTSVHYSQLWSVIYSHLGPPGFHVEGGSAAPSFYLAGHTMISINSNQCLLNT